MCIICRQYRCPPTCPAYEGRSPEHGRVRGVCDKCGRRIFEREVRHRRRAQLLCEECAEKAADAET